MSHNCVINYMMYKVKVADEEGGGDAVTYSTVKVSR